MLTHAVRNVKGMKIVINYSITQPHVVPNLYNFP